LSEKLRKIIQYPTKGQIWKVIPDFLSPYLLLEIRWDGKREVSFTGIDFAKSKLLWDNFQLAEKWWVGVSALSGGVVYFYQYADEQYPQPKDIWVVDLKRKKQVWNKSDYIFEAIGQDNLLVFQIEEGKKMYHVLNPKNCKPLKVVPDSFQPLFPNWQLPFVYQEEDNHFLTLAKFIEQKTGKKPIRQINYFEHQTHFIISYYHTKKTGLEHKLSVYDQSGALTFDTILDKELKAISDSSFFILNNYLIFVENKNTLFVYQFE